MCRSTPRPLALALLTLSLSPCCAQDWMVGVPVEFHMTSINLYGGCFPGVDQTLHIPQSTTSGVDHVGIVTSVYPWNAISITPGISDIQPGDTLHIIDGLPRDVTFPLGGGQLFLEFYAVGTPTVAGESHPCVFSQTWISDFGICPEGLYFSPQMDCVVQPSTGAQEAVDTDGRIIAPSWENGQRLRLNGSAGRGGFLLMDICGRSILEGGLTELVNGLDLSAMPVGSYVIVLHSPESAPRSTRFLISGDRP